MIPASYTIQYQVYESAENKILKIWESAPVSADRAQPWLYQMNYPLSPDRSVGAILNQVLEASGANKMSDAQLTKLNGKIKVIPNPTLKLFPPSRD